MLRMGEIMQRIEATGLVDDDARVVAAGGPLENVPLWGRMVSDVLGKTVELTDAVEVTSRGVACLLCESLSGSPAPSVGVKQEITPDEGAHVAYTQALARNNELYDLLYGGEEPKPSARL